MTDSLEPIRGIGSQRSRDFTPTVDGAPNNLPECLHVLHATCIVQSRLQSREKGV